MEHLLVTTDFSDNSKAAVRFALQMANQGQYKLVFLHVTEILKPFKWTEEFFASFEQKEIAGLEQHLKKFVMELSAETGSTVIDPQYVVRNSSSVPANMVHYAEQHNIPYICIARKGGGNTLRLFGSTASTLIEKSSVPLIVVPEDYQPKAIEHVFYASDLEHVHDELNDVLQFSTPLNAKVELIHFSSPAHPEAEQKFRSITEGLGAQGVTAHLEALDLDTPLADKLSQAVDRFKPSILVMFTRQDRTFFEKLFLSSISAEFAAASIVPLLVYRKKP